MTVASGVPHEDNMLATLNPHIEAIWKQKEGFSEIGPGVHPNPFAPGKPDALGTWIEVMADRDRYISHCDYPQLYASRHELRGWLAPAYRWARENPTQVLVLAFGNEGREFRAFQRGEYVAFDVTYPDGTPLRFVSQDGITCVHADPIDPVPVRIIHIQRIAGEWKMFEDGRGNEYPPGTPDEFSTWQSIINQGRCYLTSNELTEADFLYRYARPMPQKWMPMAYVWARENPTKRLVLRKDEPEREGALGVMWRVYQRGEYVCFDLPSHDWGGEEYFVSRDGATLVKIGQD